MKFLTRFGGFITLLFVVMTLGLLAISPAYKAKGRAGKSESNVSKKVEELANELAAKVANEVVLKEQNSYQVIFGKKLTEVNDAISKTGVKLDGEAKKALQVSVFNPNTLGIVAVVMIVIAGLLGAVPLFNKPRYMIMTALLLIGGILLFVTPATFEYTSKSQFIKAVPATGIMLSGSLTIISGLYTALLVALSNRNKTE